MVSQRKTSDSKTPRRPPATTPEARENQLTDLAVSLAETQMRNGTASSQVITHYLKLASPREAIERERLRNENELLKKKVEAMASAQRTEELMKEALQAFRSYAGEDPEREIDD